MNKPLEILTEQASRLAVEDRLILVQRILESVEPSHPEIVAVWIAEAEDRIAAFERGEIETFDADEVLTELRQKPLARP